MSYDVVYHGLASDLSKGFIRRLTVGLTCTYLAIFIVLTGSYIASGSLTDGNHSVLGGDFLAFKAAADMVAAGRYTEVYDLEAFRMAMAKYAANPNNGLMWQYPPVVHAIITPLAALPYRVAYLAWCLAGLGFLSGVFALLRFSRLAQFLLLASPLTLSVLIMGQISLFTAGLLFLAARFPGERAIIAGIAAGLMVVKPQLALLVPVAYLAAGHYRAIGAAAVTCVVVCIAAWLLFGFDAWIQFCQSLSRLNADMIDTGQGSTDPQGMTTPLSQFLLWGVPHHIAGALHWAIAAMLAGLVFLAWRQPGCQWLKAGLLCACAPLVTPYAYDHELVLCLLPVAVIASNGTKNGWLRGDRPGLFLIFVLPAMGQGLPAAELIQYPMLAAALCLALTARRYFASVSSASACSSPPMRPLRAL